MEIAMDKNRDISPADDRSLKAFLLNRFEDQAKREDRELEEMLKRYRHLAKGKALMLDNSK